MTTPTYLVAQFMTTAPHTIGKGETLEAAHLLMRKHLVRHLPVLEGGEVVGLLSLSDLQLIETLKDVDPREVLVEEAMSRSPFEVPPDALLDEVAADMVARRLDSAIVVDRDRPVGMFTTSDALRALSVLIRGRPAQ